MSAFYWTPTYFVVSHRYWKTVTVSQWDRNWRRHYKQCNRHSVMTGVFPWHTHTHTPSRFRDKCIYLLQNTWASPQKKKHSQASSYIFKLFTINKPSHIFEKDRYTYRSQRHSHSRYVFGVGWWRHKHKPIYRMSYPSSTQRINESMEQVHLRQ